MSRVHRHHDADRRWHDLDGWADHTRREEAPCEEQREENSPTTQSKGEGVMTTSKTEHPRVVSHSEWLAARQELLTQEKALTRQRDALSARVGRAATLAEASGPAGVALLDDITPESVQTYQPYWAVRAHLLQRLGRRTEALDAFDRAISLTEDSAIRQFLLRRRGQRAYAHGSCYA